VRNREDSGELQNRFRDVKFFWGDGGVEEMAGGVNADIVLSAIVGAAGLRPTLAALKSRKRVALANKESLVIAGEVMVAEAARSGSDLLPVDSEHSAIFQALTAGKREEVRRLILTASGGPFLKRDKKSLENVTVEEALKHPNWSMGPKITVDSATLMNKGLEVIEARWLFGFPVEKIDVQIHPQSIVHSMVEYCDGSVMAQMGTPDMRCAISYALAWPDRIESGVEPLSLPRIETLSFFEPDMERFPALSLARQVAREGGSLPAVLNAANEVMVERFLKNQIGFMDIVRLVEGVISRHKPVPVRNLEDVLEADRWSREVCGEL
jgi:1-deoxy-D-xylulose-5-phosphate reductoisomerase